MTLVAGKYFTFLVLVLLAMAAYGSDHGHGGGKALAPPEAGKSGPDGLPVMGEAPEFTLVNQDGEGFGSSKLKGKVSLFNFVYTQCETACPVTSHDFSRLQHMLKEKGLFGAKAVLITISFDPERDTPEVLKEYSAKFKADHSGWYWLTGPKEEIERVVQGGFWVQYQKTRLRGAQAMGDKGHGDHGGAPAGYDFEHAPISVLTDGDGNIRAVYQMGTDLGEIVRDMQSLIQQ